jgi:hypothetical protein
MFRLSDDINRMCGFGVKAQLVDFNCGEGCSGDAISRYMDWHFYCTRSGCRLPGCSTTAGIISLSLSKQINLKVIRSVRKYSMNWLNVENKRLCEY